MSYNFAEGKLGPNFAPEKISQFKDLIDAGLSFVVMSMPGVGASYFLKYLTHQDFARFFHVDLYDLPFLTSHEFYKLLLTELGGKTSRKTDEQMLKESKSILKSLAGQEKEKKIVIIFNHFDQLKKAFDWNFLSNIQSLSQVSSGNIVLIFTSIKPVSDLAPDAVTGGNINFFSRILYFKPYSEKELKKLLEVQPEPKNPQDSLERLIELSGGHNQLFHILLASHKENLLLDQFVRLQLKELVDYLNYSQRKQIQKISFGKKTEVDDYLLNIGMVKKTASSYTLFTPLLSEYIKISLPNKLPPQEAKLFKLLRSSIGSIVSKDEIFSILWEKNPEKATDWALDALVYRLRKHPYISSQGYVIESHKKLGYSLIQG